jgi:hypothetical protein
MVAFDIHQVPLPAGASSHPEGIGFVEFGASGFSLLSLKTYDVQSPGLPSVPSKEYFAHNAGVEKALHSPFTLMRLDTHSYW